MKSQPIKTENDKARESDGRFALQMKSNRAVQRRLRHDAKLEQRRREVIAANDGDPDAWLLWA